MKAPPSDPFAFQARVMDALLGDIADPEAKTFPRLDALREVSKQFLREREGGNALPVD